MLGIFLGVLLEWNHFILSTLCIRYCYYLWFTEKNTEAQGGPESHPRLHSNQVDWNLVNPQPVHCGPYTQPQFRAVVLRGIQGRLPPALILTRIAASAVRRWGKGSHNGISRGLRKPREGRDWFCQDSPEKRLVLSLRWKIFARIKFKMTFMYEKKTKTLSSLIGF